MSNSIYSIRTLTTFHLLVFTFNILGKLSIAKRHREKITQVNGYKTPNLLSYLVNIFEIACLNHTGIWKDLISIKDQNFKIKLCLMNIYTNTQNHSIQTLVVIKNVLKM